MPKDSVKKRHYSPRRKTPTRSTRSGARNESKKIRSEIHRVHNIEEPMETEESANFNEGNQLIQITVRGQYSDFDEEKDDEGEEGEIMDEIPPARDEVDTEVSFKPTDYNQKNQVNNNATLDLRRVIEGKTSAKNSENRGDLSMNQVQSMIEESQRQTANFFNSNLQIFKRSKLHFLDNKNRIYSRIRRFRRLFMLQRGQMERPRCTRKTKDMATVAKVNLGNPFRKSLNLK